MITRINETKTITIIKKIVVYILLFSFLLVDLPQGALAGSALPPTPPPGGYEWAYVLDSSGSTGLRFFYNQNANTQDFANVERGANLMGPSVGWALFGSASLAYTYGNHNWDIYSAGTISTEKFYIFIQSNVGGKDFVRNICLTAGDSSFGTIFPSSYLTSNSNLFVLDNINNSAGAFICFNQLNTDGTVSKQDSTVYGKIPGLASTSIDYNVPFQKIQQGGYTHDALVAPLTIPKPTDTDDNACKGNYAQRQIKTTDDAQKWATNEITHLQSIDTDPTHAALNVIKAKLADSSISGPIYQNMITQDTAALQNYYGTASQIPSVPINESTYTAIRNAYQTAQDAGQNGDYMSYFKGYLNFSLIKYYALVNLTYYKCIQSKNPNDPAATLYNSTVEGEINALDTALATNIGGSSTGGGSDYCTIQTQGGFLSKIASYLGMGGGLSYVFCMISYGIYYALSYLVGWANDIALHVIGVDITNQ